MSTPGTRSTRWNIPYQRNPFFTGREEILSHLYHALQADNVVALSHPQGISGLGGIGKTQTALEYAYRYHAEYEAVLWVRADSITALTSSYVDLAHLLDIPEQNEQNQNVVVEAVLNWLRSHPGWFLIFDNIDDLSVAAPFLPMAGIGHILFTTRAHALGGIAQRLEMQKMEPETGALLLLRRAGIVPLQATLDTATKEDRRMASDISQGLDGLPLALDQAGAYIKEVPCTLMNYLALYQTRRRDLLQARGSAQKDYPASVATTWSLSFEKVSQGNPAAAELLDFCAFLAADAIPEEMITGGAKHLTPLLQMVATHPLEFDQALARLLAYSLVSRNEDAMLSVHRLVQVILKDNMNQAMQNNWAQRTITVVNAAFPTVEVETWQQCERYLSQALKCAALVDEYAFDSSEAARLLHQTALYLDDHARYEEAEPLYKQALTIREQMLGPNDPDTADNLNDLAGVYRNQGKYEEAKVLLERALAIREQVLGPDHPVTASSLNNLAALYDSMGNREESKALLERALAIFKEAFGLNHPETAIGLTNLADFYYYRQSNYTEAEPLYHQVVAIWEQLVGPNHPNTAQSLRGLAGVYRNQGKYEEAKVLLERALAIRVQVLGPEHPDVAQSLTDLAGHYDSQGRYEEAKALLERALTIDEQSLGSDHPTTKLTRERYVKLLEKMSKKA